MTITRRTAIFATAFALTAAQTAAAQRHQDRQYEVGMDAAIGFANSQTIFELPVQAIRVGISVTPTVSVEPTLGLITGSGTTLLNFDIGVPFDIDQTPGGSQLFLRPLFGLTHESFSGAGSNTNTSLGIGAGIRVPMMSHLDSRFEARYRRWFGDNGFNEVDLLAGISVILP